MLLMSIDAPSFGGIYTYLVVVTKLPEVYSLLKMTPSRRCSRSNNVQQLLSVVQSLQYSLQFGQAWGDWVNTKTYNQTSLLKIKIRPPMKSSPKPSWMFELNVRLGFIIFGVFSPNIMVFLHIRFGNSSLIVISLKEPIQMLFKERFQNPKFFYFKF